MARYGVNHLVRRNGTFYFRQAIPIWLRGRLDRKEINVSLRTSEPATAKRRCRRLSSYFEAFFARVDHMDGKSVGEINAVLRSYFAELVHEADDVTSTAVYDPKFDRAFEIEQSNKDILEYRRRIVAHDFDKVTMGQADRLAAALPGSSNLTDVDGRSMLSIGILRARIAQATLYLQRLQGVYADVDDPLFGGVEQQGVVGGLLPAAAQQKTLSIREAVNKYVAYKHLANDWVQKTEAENKRVLNWFIETVGEEFPAGELSVVECRDFRDRLLALPANFNKGATNVAKTFKAATEQPQEIKGTHIPHLAPKTARKYFDHFKTFLNWAENDGHIVKNPARKLVMFKKNQDDNGRQPFSNEQLERLFSSPIYRGYWSAKRPSRPGDIVTRDGRFWIPLIGLFAGLRLGEIVQLLVADLKVENGIDFFDITKGEPEDGKKLKTVQSKRRVPVHEELKKIGFKVYLNERRAKDPNGRLFPEVKFGKNGYASANFSKFFGRYADAIGIKTEHTTFHSLRHNFVDALRNASVDHERYKALIGHKDTSVTGGYGFGFALDVLKADIDKVAYPMSFAQIYLGP